MISKEGVTVVLQQANIGNERKTIVIENGKIADITDKEVPDGINLNGKRVIPGLIDIHTHGRMGMDTMDADFEPLCRQYAACGTTAFLPTTMTMGTDDLLRVTQAKTDFDGAQILGFHFEGPYISEKYKGAQNEAYIQTPSVEAFSAFSNVRMVTVAPELEGSEEFIRAVSKHGTVVSLGHTACDYETALCAMDCGANCLTHTYNAMPPLHHRNPGPIGAAVERGIYAQVIGDGLHVQPPVLLATYRMFGADRMVLISDSICPAGLPDGEYASGGLPVMLKDGVARLPDGTIAGSCATLWDCVKTTAAAGIPFEDALRMATRTPAELLGVPKGRIAVGYDADLLVLSEEGEIETVIIGGRIFR